MHAPGTARDLGPNQLAWLRQTIKPFKDAEATALRVADDRRRVFDRTLARGRWARGSAYAQPGERAWAA